jgi:transposase
MYIVENKKRVGNKEYTSTLLVEGYREDKKVKHRTISNLSSWPKGLVEAFRLLLKGGKVTTLKELRHSQGKSCGGLIVIYEICKRLGILRALSKSKKAMLAILLIIGRILTQGSRLHLVEWSKDQAVEEVLNIKYLDEDDLYETLDWLCDNQEKIEDKLFRLRNKKELEEVFLYDVTSTYFEGMENELSEYGYNRDRKKGKKQIVIGLMTDKEGYPVSIEVFKGNTQDPKTVLNQLKKLRSRFGVKRVIFVGDRGMIKKQEIEDINELKWSFITAVTRPQIKKLVNTGAIQMSLFEEEIAEVEYQGYRYIIRKNPQRAKEIQENRKSRIEYIIKKIIKKNDYLAKHKKASEEVALKDINKEIERRKLVRIVRPKIDDRTLSYEIDTDSIADISILDGCYAIKTDLPKEALDKEIIHDRYKDLTQVEKAFRTIKTALEEIRPVYVRKESRTRGHVFVCMLAYMIVKYVWDNLKGLGFTQSFIFETLDKIQYSSYKFQDKIIKVLPKDLLEHQDLILNKLQIKLPHNL